MQLMYGLICSSKGVWVVLGQAIYESVLPRQAGDRVPVTRAGMLVALTDRLDSLVGLTAAGCAPTASADPFGLRRICYGMLEVRFLDSPQHHPPTPVEIRKQRILCPALVWFGYVWVIGPADMHKWAIRTGGGRR